MKKIITLILLITICMNLLVACSSSGKVTQEPLIENNIEETKALEEVTNIPQITLTEEKIEHLYKLGKVWGFLKYYHPIVAKGEYDWDQELFRVLSKVLEVKSEDEFDEILLEWIDGLGSYEKGSGSYLSFKKVKIEPNLSWINPDNFDETLVLKLQEIKSAKRGRKNYYVKMDSNNKSPVFDNEKSYDSMAYPDAGYRLLALYRYWNIMEYYFPYKYLIGEDWNEVLLAFIPKFNEASNAEEYNFVVLELATRINDGHAYLKSSIEPKTVSFPWGKAFAPIEVSSIEGKAVISAFSSPNVSKETGLAFGDVIVKVDGKSTEDIIHERMKYTPSSNDDHKLFLIFYQLLATSDDYIDIVVLREGKEIEARVKADSSWPLKMPYSIQSKSFDWIGEDIGYINIGSIKISEIEEVMTKFANTKGLIIDHRAYPDEFVIFELGKYLMPSKIDFVKFSHGNINKPGLFTSNIKQSIGSRNTDYYKGNVLILVNERSISLPEYIAMAFRTAPKATVIGSPTAGADGDVSYFSLPGGITAHFSGVGIYYPDGRETQRVGILPDVIVKPTIQGIREERDEVLEEAVKIINGK